MDVKVYSTPTCPYCKMTKEFLQESGVSFQDIDVSSSPAAAEEMVKISGHMGVPVVVVDGEVVVGFDKEKLSELIKED